MTMDERIVSDILFGDQSKMGQFRGGGDKVGAALSNFINARNDARNRALRNQEWDRWTKSRNSGSNNNNDNNNQIYGVSGSGYTPAGTAIGADANGIYGINSQADRQGIGADANGVYGVAPATASNNKYTFNESDYIPQASNGYHINDNPRMAEWGSPQDWQIQQARNAMRDVYEGSGWYKYPYNGFGSAIAKAEQPQGAVDRYPQELVGLTGEDLQRAGQAYNQRIGGGNYNFAKAIQNAESAVPPQVAPRVQPTPQYTTNTTPPPSGSSVADFKRYDNEQNYGTQNNNTPSVADFKRNEGGYSNPMVEVQDPSIAYPQVKNKPQVNTSGGIGFTYHHNPNNPSFLDKIIDDGQQFGFRYNRDPNNPSILDRLFYNPNAQ